MCTKRLKKYGMKSEKKGNKPWNKWNNFSRLIRMRLMQHKGHLPLRMIMQDRHHLPNLHHPTTAIILVLHKVTLLFNICIGLSGVQRKVCVFST
ncbi:hypothetical protein QL285_077946 [Trifolium repens]|nr:hypothetical protein QL285_077946 [Trifolium repens]